MPRSSPSTRPSWPARRRRWRGCTTAWASRTPVVVALAVDPGRFRAPRSYADDEVGPAWLLDPGFTPEHDRLHFLVWANTYDARRPGDPVWWWARKAARLGASPAPPGATYGDVVLPDRRGRLGRRGSAAVDRQDGAVVHPSRWRPGHLTPVPPTTAPTSDLAPDQLAAVNHGAGPARVIAPAGSGKTRVLTERLRHLVVDRGYEPGAVVAVAYNRKARDEMVARTTGRGRPHPHAQRPRLRDRRRRAGPPAGGAGGPGRPPHPGAPGAPGRPPAQHRPAGPLRRGAVGRAARPAQTPPTWRTSGATSPGLAEAFPAYRDALASPGGHRLRRAGVAGGRAAAAMADFRRAQQARHRHMLVDEFQDLTPAHVLLVRLLAAPAFDVFGVGDDDQVIYGHAGASPRFLTDFERYFPGRRRARPGGQLPVPARRGGRRPPPADPQPGAGPQADPGRPRRGREAARRARRPPPPTRGRGGGGGRRWCGAGWTSPGWRPPTWPC